MLREQSYGIFSELVSRAWQGIVLKWVSKDEFDDVRKPCL